MAEAEETRLTANSWDDELRARGYRVTPQRQLVLEAIARLDHATPEEIAERVQQTARGVNISTIYRTLELLDKLGLVTHTHLRHGAPTYHLASDADHVHLVCQDCERVTEISRDAIRALVVGLDEAQGFETDVTHLTVFGRCAECRGRDQKSPSLCPLCVLQGRESRTARRARPPAMTRMSAHRMTPLEGCGAYASSEAAYAPQPSRKAGRTPEMSRYGITGAEARARSRPYGGRNDGCCQPPRRSEGSFS